jgi:hypothetical protein
MRPSAKHRRVWTFSLTATDINGVPLPPSPVPQPVWDESFRYYRLSQSTDDLFDAYRNLYLGLESLLSLIRPKMKREKEGDWLRAALSAANAFAPLSKYVPPGTSDAISYLVKDLYLDHRNSVFHSKRGGATLPHDQVHRGPLEDSLRRWGASISIWSVTA